MKAARFRGWRFDLPELDAPQEEAGLRNSPTGGMAMVEGTAAVRQAVFLLLSTRPGERVMRPEYGCHLDRLQFAPNDETTAGLAIHYVRQSLMRWEPRIEILFLDAVAHGSDPGRLEILLEYRVRSTLERVRMVYPLSLSGEVS